MSFELALKALAATYIISTIMFLVLGFMNVGTQYERFVIVLLWPLYIFLVGLYMVLVGVLDFVQFILETLWGDEFEDDDDESSDNTDESSQ